MIYWNGCSFVKGYELTDKESNFVHKVSNHFGQSFINDSKVGGSNDRIYRTTIEYCLKNKPDLVVIMWSGINRQEYLMRLENTWRQMNWSNWYCNLKTGLTDVKRSVLHHHPGVTDNEQVVLAGWAKFKSVKYNLKTTLNYMIGLKYFLQAKNIPYLYYNFSDGQYKPFFKFLDEEYFEAANITWSPVVTLTREDYLAELPHLTEKIGMYDFTKKHGYKMGMKDHPLEDAHQAYGEYIIKDIYDNEYDKILV